MYVLFCVVRDLGISWFRYFLLCLAMSLCRYFVIPLFCYLVSSLFMYVFEYGAMYVFLCF